MRGSGQPWFFIVLAGCTCFALARSMLWGNSPKFGDPLPLLIGTLPFACLWVVQFVFPASFPDGSRLDLYIGSSWVISLVLLIFSSEFFLLDRWLDRLGAAAGSQRIAEAAACLGLTGLAYAMATPLLMRRQGEFPKAPTIIASGLALNCLLLFFGIFF